VICPTCGAENKSGAALCAVCGSPLPEAPFLELKKQERPSPAGGEKAASAEAPSPVERQTAPLPWNWEERAGTSREATEAASDDKGMGQDQTLAFMMGGDDESLVSTREKAAEQVSPPREAAASGPSPGGLGAESSPAPPGLDESIVPGGGGAIEPREADYYIPPEADYLAVEHPSQPQQREERPPPAESPPQEPASTQVIASVSGDVAAAAARPKLICPECYAPNAEHNRFCQECGSALPLSAAGRTADQRAQASPPGYGRTAVMATGMPPDASLQSAYALAEPGVDRASTAKRFGVSDILALLSMAAVAMALVPAFTWKKGIEASIFSHQGAFASQRTDLLGGPGILPYSGFEFFTVGLVAAVGAGLALIFLAVRVGRGPMYLLSGCILLFPLFYLLFQAVLPLRQMGISVQPAVGLEGIFLGNTANAGLGPPLWLIAGAGVMLIVAGFLAPPRGWGRLFSFILFSSLILGAAFICAACYNWNLFISDASLPGSFTGSNAAVMHCFPVFPPH
jgi:hypothetical protein